MQLSAIDLNLMPLLHALFQERTIQAAAKRVALSPSAFSHALGRARQTLGDPIAVKVGRHLQLTERGRQLRDLVAVAISSADAVFAPPRPFTPAQLERPFQVAMGDHLQLILLPKVLAQVRRQAPRMQLLVRTVGPGADLAEVASGDLDLAIAVFMERPPGIQHVDLMEDHLVTLMSARHDLARKARLSLRDFTAYPHLLMAPRGGTSSLLDTKLAETGMRRWIAATAPNFLVVPHLLVDSDLLVAMSRRTADLLCRRYPLRTRPLPIKMPPAQVTMAWHARNTGDEAHRWLRGLIRKAAGRVSP